MTGIHDPSLLDSAEFLLGPHLLDAEPVVDRLFAKDFGTALREMLDDDPRSLDVVEDSPETTSDVDPTLVFRETLCGVVLFDGDVPVGGILGTDIVLDGRFRGRGLGAEIVLESYMREGGFRFWDLDEPGFSPAGLRTMAAAHRMGCDRAVFGRKWARLSRDDVHAPGL